MGNENYLIGGALLYFNDGTGFRDLGNIPNISLNRTLKELEHYTAKSGKRMLDMKLITEARFGLKFKLDEFNADNLNALFYGDGAADAAYSAGSVTDEEAVAYIDRLIFTAKRNISAVVVKDDTGTTTYTAGADYSIEDAVTGAIKILSGGGIANEDIIKISYSYAAGTQKKIKVGQKFNVTGSARLEFKVLNGKPFTWIIGNAALKAEGDTALDSEKWSEADFTLDVLAASANPGEEYGHILEG